MFMTAKRSRFATASPDQLDIAEVRSAHQNASRHAEQNRHEKAGNQFAKCNESHSPEKQDQAFRPMMVFPPRTGEIRDSENKGGGNESDFQRPRDDVN